MIAEAVIFLFASICGLFIAGFAVHMFIGGLVSADTEHQVIVAVCSLIACGICFMAWDVINKRAKR